MDAKIHKNSHLSKKNANYLTGNTLYYRVLRSNRNPFSELCIPQRDAGHYHQEMSPFKLYPILTGLKSGQFKGALFKTFLIKDISVNIPPEYFYSVFFFGKEQIGITAERG